MIGNLGASPLSVPVVPLVSNSLRILKLRLLAGVVRYADQLSLLEYIGHKVTKNAVGGEQNQACDQVWEVCDALLAHNKQKEMKDFMVHNGMKLERVSKNKNKFELAYEVADAICFGKPGPCPVCDNVGTLRSCYPCTEGAPTVQCHGIVKGSSTHCDFGRKVARAYGAAGVRREKVEIPEALFTKKTFFKDYELPAAVLALPAGAPAAGGAAAAAAPAGGKKRKPGKNTAEGGVAAAAAPKKAKKLQGDEASLQVHAEAPQGKIYVGDGGTCAYNVTLAQADLETGVNKFYILQLLEAQGGGYTFWTKWGRTGQSGKKSKAGRPGQEGDMQHDYDDLAEALKDFEKKFKDKTKNKWSDRANFEPKGLYSMVAMDGNDTGGESEKNLKRASKASAPKKKKKKKKSKNAPAAAASTLEPRVEEFVKRIFDEDSMNDSLKRQNIDVKKMPLGELSRAQVSKGYEILCEIQELLNEEKAATDTTEGMAAAGGAEDEIAAERRNTKIKSLSSQFYTNIPHVFPEGSPPSYINSADELRLKTDLIQSLEQMRDVANTNEELDDDAPKTDEQYKSMNCPLKAVPKDSEEWRMIADYVKHGQGHKRSTMGNSLSPDQTVELIDVIAANRPEEEEAYTKDPNLLKNRQLLWHGSGMGNWGSILKTGLRIAPPEAPSTGWLFGKGLYFANVLGKSAAYCAMTDAGDYGVLALLEVALGDAHMCKAATQASGRAAAAVEKKGVGHTWAVGTTFPTQPHESLEDGTSIPCGELKRDINRLGKTKSEKLKGPGTLEYDEMIVYQKAQAKIRYVVTVKFGEKGDVVDLTD